MREVALERLPSEVRELFEAAQRQRVVVTRNGTPYALLVGVEHKDAEDLLLEASPDFWSMIQNSRRETDTVSLEEFEAGLRAEEQRGRSEAVEVRDPGGNVLGHVAAAEPPEDADGRTRLERLFDLEGAERVLAQQWDQGRSWEEVKQRLQASGNDG